MASTAIVSMYVNDDYCSTTSIISRPLYFPQCGQTRWGSFGSWQLGHCDRLALVSESCVRRAEVRRLECRRFGFGMLLSLLLSLLIQMFQRRPAIIGRSPLAGALFLIPVLPADRTDSLAIFAAYPLHRQRQQDKFPQNVVEFHSVAFVEAHLRFVLVDRFLLAIPFRHRTIVQLKVGIDRTRGRLQTAVAIRFHQNLYVPFYPNLAQQIDHQLRNSGRDR